MSRVFNGMAPKIFTFKKKKSLLKQKDKTEWIDHIIRSILLISHTRNMGTCRKAGAMPEAGYGCVSF